jgi:hypothetical protein
MMQKIWPWAAKMFELVVQVRPDADASDLVTCEGIALTTEQAYQLSKLFVTEGFEVEVEKGSGEGDHVVYSKESRVHGFTINVDIRNNESGVFAWDQVSGLSQFG